jgi:allantoinase
LILRSTRVVFSDGVRPAEIHVEQGTIARILPLERDAPAERFVISPGIVDTHVHVNEPGRTEWEGFDTATRAAAAGGITTIVDMPLNSVPATTSVAALEAKRAAARGRVHVDAGFWGGVVPGNAGELDALIDAGVRGFKCFLVPSGVDEFEHVGERDLREALPILARRGVPLLVHAEEPSLIRSAEASRSGYADYLATRPPAAEVEAIRLIARLAHKFGARVHIVHVASAEAAAEVARAKADGVRITAETCPHYLTFAAEDIPGDATEYKCAPPIRGASHRDALWRALGDGTLDLVATDHSPSPASMKIRGDFVRSWGGISSLELSLAAIWSGVAQRFSAADAGLKACATYLSESPAKLANLVRKGRIAEGYDADLVVWDPEAERVVDASRLQQRHKLTPYAGRTLRGRVRSTYLHGVEIWNGDQLVHANQGCLL